MLIVGEYVMYMFSVVDFNEVFGYYYVMECFKDCVYCMI